MTEKVILAVEPKVQRFSADSEKFPGRERLVEVLQAQRETQPVLVTRPTDVMLNQYGLVQNQYRLTATAITQLGAQLAPGLPQTIFSISGIRKRLRNLPMEKYSVKLAIQLLNDMIRNRFEVLEDRARLIIDPRSRTVEGVVGPKYHFLSNLEVFFRVEEFLQRIGSSATFHEASLAGRRLQLRYRNLEKAFVIQDSSARMDRFTAGWHFNNSELGDCCLKGGALLFRQQTSTASLTPYTETTRLVHIHGQKFDAKFAALLEGVRELVSNAPKRSIEMQKLESVRLQLGGMREDHDKRVAEIVAALRQVGCFRTHAHDAINHAMLYGSHRREASSNVDQPAPTHGLDVIDRVQLRTNYDLYNALGRIARRCSPTLQERLEQVAYDVLIGNVVL